MDVGRRVVRSRLHMRTVVFANFYERSVRAQSVSDMNLGSLNGPQTKVLNKSLLLFAGVLAEKCRLPCESSYVCMCA